MSAGALIDGANQGFERAPPPAGNLLDPGFAEVTPRPTPRGGKYGTLRPIERLRVDLQQVEQRHVGVYPAAESESFGRGRPFRGVATFEPAEVVEGDLRRGPLCQDLLGSRIQITHQPVTKSLGGDHPQLFFDLLEQPDERGATVQGILEIDVAGTQGDRIDFGEPSNGACQIQLFGFAAVSFNINQGSLSAQCHGKGCQEDIVDSRMKRSRHRGEDARGDFNGQVDAEMSCRAHRIEARIEGYPRQEGDATLDDSFPLRKLGFGHGRDSLLREILCPYAEWRGFRFRGSLLIMGDGMPELRQIGEQNPPGDAIDCHMMDG